MWFKCLLTSGRPSTETRDGEVCEHGAVAQVACGALSLTAVQMPRVPYAGSIRFPRMVLTIADVRTGRVLRPLWGAWVSPTPLLPGRSP